MKVFRFSMGVISSIVSFLFLLFFLIVILAQRDLPTALFFLIPGGLLLWLSIVLFKGSTTPSQPQEQLAPGAQIPDLSGEPPQAFVYNPMGYLRMDARFVNDFVRSLIQERTAAKASQVTFSLDPGELGDLGEAFNVLFGQAPQKSEPPKGPISVDCPGCGAKTVVYPEKAVKCEFCGTAITYKN
ncbi:MULTISPECIES: hypothetical protein [Paenibacillus]|uniref:hypothetical protein n=1 Tax=Paenibacillus TaxID=44249 RepID=UPI002FE123EC